MIKIKVKCPLCKKADNLEIDEFIIKKEECGVISIIVGKDKICPHNFIACIDKNLAIRDTFLLDFELETPQIEILTPKEKKEIKIDDYKVDLLKINFLHLI